MKRELKALSIVCVLIAMFAIVLTACGGGGGGGGTADGAPNAPGAFSLLIPTDGATGIVLSSPTFSWQVSSGVTSYTFQLSTNASFTDITHTHSLASTTYTPSITLTAGATYHWRVLAVNTGGTTTSSTFSFTTKKSGDSIWSAATATTSLGTGFDTVYGMAKDANAVYAVGYDTKQGYKQWRIEKRNITDGSLVTGFDSDGVITGVTTTESAATAIAIDTAAGYLYVAGYAVDSGSNVADWRIEKRSLSSGALETTAFGVSGIVTSGTGTTDSIANAVAIDAAYLYVAGYDTTPGGKQEWRTEKRNLSDGQLVSAFVGDSGSGNGIIQNHPSGSGDDIPYGIAVDGSHVYIVGSDEVAGPGTPGWRIEILNVDSGATVTAISEGATGSVYFDEALAIAIDSTSLYVVGYDSQTTMHDDQWRIEKRRISDGSLETAFNATGIIQENPSSIDISSYDDANAITIDGSYIYVAGFDSVPGDEQWRIEKRDIVTGALVPAFGTSGVVNLNSSLTLPYNEAWAIVGDTHYLCVAGDMWHFEKIVK